MMFEGLSTMELIFIGLPFTLLGFALGLLFVGFMFKPSFSTGEKE